MENLSFCKIEERIKGKLRRGTVLWHFLKTLKTFILSFQKAPLVIRERIFRSSIFILDDEIISASLFPQKILDETIRMFQPKTVLDLGCGTGQSLDYFLSKGIETVGVEGSRLAIKKALHPQHIKKFNLTRELRLGRHFDLIWSFEFVEHIHPQFIGQLMRSFSNHSDTIVLSAAPPGQGGDGHFNEQPHAFWIGQFKKYGFQYQDGKTQKLKESNDIYCHNMLVFERNNQDFKSEELHIPR